MQGGRSGAMCGVGAVLKGRSGAVCGVGGVLKGRRGAVCGVEAVLKGRSGWCWCSVAVCGVGGVLEGPSATLCGVGAVLQFLERYSGAVQCMSVCECSGAVLVVLQCCNVTVCAAFARLPFACVL